MQRVRVKALDRLTDLTQDVRLSLTVGTSSMIYLRIIVHPADKPRHASFLELPVAGKQPEPQKADSPPHGPRSATEVQFQPQAVTRERPDLRLPFQNRCLCVCEHQHVVHVAHVVAHLQYLVVNALKVTFHIQMQPVCVSSQETMRPIQRPIAPLPAPTGVTVVNEHTVEPRLDHIMHRMMQHTISYRRRRDHPYLRIPHREQPVPPVAVPARHQRVVKLENFLLKIELEFRPLTTKTPPVP